MKFSPKLIIAVVIAFAVGFCGMYFGAKAYKSYKESNAENPVIMTIPAENFEDDTEEFPDVPDTPDNEGITVHNFKELIDNLGSDRVIYIANNINITGGILEMAKELKWTPSENDNSDANLQLKSDYYEIVGNQYFDLQERDTLDPNDIIKKQSSYLRIRDCHNLTLEGHLGKDVSITIDNPDTPVLDFKENSSLSIKNLDLVHTLPDGAECGPNAPVIQLDTDKNVRIENCELNGSGTEGVLAKNVNDVLINNTTIYNCKDYAIYLNDVKNCTVVESAIVENDLNFGMFYLDNSSLNILNTRITGNNGWENRFINIYDDKDESPSSITFNECVIKGNKNFKMNSEQLSSFNASNTIDFSDFVTDDVN